jgi:hypothetical protein
MRLLIDLEARVIPWVSDAPSTIVNPYCLPLASSTVLVGPSAFKTLKSVLRDSNGSRGIQLMRNYLERGEFVFLDHDGAEAFQEKPKLPEGTFPELVDDDQKWNSILHDVQGVTRPGEDRQEAFDRIIGAMVKYSRVLDLIDPWITPHLLSRAIQDDKYGLFWMNNLLSSNARKVCLYTALPTVRRLSSSASFRSLIEVKDLTDRERMRIIQTYVASRKAALGFAGDIEIRFHDLMPHDRYLRFGMSKGSVYVLCPKGIDPFEVNPISSVHKFSPLTSQDWSHVMMSPEWGSDFQGPNGDDAYVQLGSPIEDARNTSTKVFVPKSFR